MISLCTWNEESSYWVSILGFFKNLEKLTIFCPHAKIDPSTCVCLSWKRHVPDGHAYPKFQRMLDLKLPSLKFVYVMNHIYEFESSLWKFVVCLLSAYLRRIRIANTVLEAQSTTSNIKCAERLRLDQYTSSINTCHTLILEWNCIAY